MGKKKDARDDDCCERYKKGKKPCKDCPRFADLSKDERKQLRDKYR